MHACAVLLLCALPCRRVSPPSSLPLPSSLACSPGFYVVEDEPPEVLETAADGVTPLVVAPRIELTLEWLIESPPPEHTWEEPPIFYDGEPPPPPPPPSDGCRLLPAAMPSRRPPLLLFCFLDLHLADRCAHRYLPRPQLLTRSEPEAGGLSLCISD
jgi:hypothetical protein